MLLLKFNPEELKGVCGVEDIYAVFGIGEGPECNVWWGDRSIFGDAANYANIFCTPGVKDIILKNHDMGKLHGRSGDSISMSLDDVDLLTEWYEYAPISEGPRYRAMEEKVKVITGREHLPDSFIAIFTPEDEGYLPVRGTESSEPWPEF